MPTPLCLLAMVTVAQGLTVPTLRPADTVLWQTLTAQQIDQHSTEKWNVAKAIRTGVRLHVAPLETKRAGPSVTELLHGMGESQSLRNGHLMATFTNLS